MATIDLLFSQTPVTGQPVSLVFGAAADAVVVAVEFTLEGQLPQPALHGVILGGPVVQISMAGTLPQPPLTAAFDLRYIAAISLYGLLPDTPLTAAFDAQYLTNTARPTVGQVATVVQVARQMESGLQHFEQQTTRTNAGVQAGFTEASRVSPSTLLAFEEALRTQQGRSTGFQDAVRLDAVRANTKWQDGLRDRREQRTDMFQDATRAPSSRIHGRFQEGVRDRRTPVSNRSKIAVPRTLGYQGHAGAAVAKRLDSLSNFQEGRRPPAGLSVAIVQPVATYRPGSDLVFFDTTNGTLIFIRDDYTDPPVIVDTVVIPIRRVYIVINDAMLRRVDGNIHLPTFSMSLALDVDSWTWGFNASLPGDMLSSLEPAPSGAPVEVEAIINGVPYRALIEGVARSRTFGKASLQVQGRGKTALLDAPYAPVMSFGNSTSRTAQQIMGDILTVNGVSNGWAVNWGLTDWLVPAGVFGHQGSYITALNAIAAAAGGYIQPHATGQSVSILPRYPSMPDTWANADFELPSSITTTEAIAWVEKARYNRVFVSGVQQGVLGQVTRAGTAGDLVAPMVTDSLITTAAAARQRGLSVLANTGRIATVSLKLPVLAETGIITPGKMVRYVDGVISRTGIVRSTAVDVVLPEIWQTISVETHV